MLKKITNPSPGDADAPDLNRHQRKCEICNHPDRDAIEEEFVHWHQPYAISSRYNVSKQSIYRHAHATGLIVQRRENTRSILERILEQAAGTATRITGQTVINALRAYTCLTDDGRWVEPPSRVVFSTSPPIAHPPHPHPAEAELPEEASLLALTEEGPPVAELLAKGGAVLDLPQVEDPEPESPALLPPEEEETGLPAGRELSEEADPSTVPEPLAEVEATEPVEIQEPEDQFLIEAAAGAVLI